MKMIKIILGIYESYGSALLWSCENISHHIDNFMPNYFTICHQWLRSSILKISKFICSKETKLHHNTVDPSCTFSNLQLFIWRQLNVKFCFEAIAIQIFWRNLFYKAAKASRISRTQFWVAQFIKHFTRSTMDYVTRTINANARYCKGLIRYQRQPLLLWNRRDIFLADIYHSWKN